MTEFSEDIAEVSVGFAEIFSKAAVSQNIEKLRIAEGTISAATDAINLEKEVGRRKVAQALAKNVGALSAQQAFTGGGIAGSGAALIGSSTFQAADQAAIIDANAAAKEVAVIFQNQPILEDPILAAIQGLTTGLEVGTSIANSLFAEADVHNFAGPGGFFTQFTVPGFDINDFIEGLGGP